MATVRIGLDTTSVALPSRAAIGLAAELSLHAVELDGRGDFAPDRLSLTGVREVRKLLDDRRLSVAALSFRTRYGYDTAHLLDARVAGTKSAMEWAQRLGSPIVVNQIGHIPEDNSPEWGLLVDTLTDLAAHGQRVGTLLAAEVGAERLEDWRRLLSALPEHGLLLDVNLGQIATSGGSAAAFCAEFGRLVGHVHATDGFSDASRRRSGLSPLGRGDVDYPAVLAALDECGYRGPFTLQHSGRMDVQDELREAAEFLRRL